MRMVALILIQEMCLCKYYLLITYEIEFLFSFIFCNFIHIFFFSEIIPKIVKNITQKIQQL